MAKATYTKEGGNIVIQFPPYGQIGPSTLNLLVLYAFQKTGSEFSNRYRSPYYTAKRMVQLARAAKKITDLYNTGAKEYTRELLTPNHTRNHGN